MSTKGTKHWMSALILIAAAGIAGPAHAGPGPFTPPPATNVITPLTGDRDSAGGFPSASVVTRAGCAGPAVASVVVNGAPVPAPHETASGTGMRTTIAPAVVNGAATPGSGAMPSAADWCGGGYRQDAGTNFGAGS